MNCKKCGFILNDQNPTCPSCGEVNEFYKGGINNSAPVAPAAPVQPAATATPVTPVAPVEPVVPTAPVQPAPAAPVQPTPAAPVQPAATATPVTPVASVEPVAPATPVAPVQPVPTINTMTSAPVAPKKKNLGFIIIVIVLGLIIVGLGVFVGIKLFGGDKAEGGNNNNVVNNDTNNNNNNNNNNNDSTEPTPTSTDSNNGTFEYEGYKFTLPDGYYSLENEGKQMVAAYEEEYLLLGKGIYSGGFSSLENDLESGLENIKQSITAQGGTFVTAKEETVSGTKFYYIEFKFAAANDSVFIAEMPDKTVFFGEVVYLSEQKEKAFKTTSEIIKSAKSASSSFAPSKDKIESVTFDIAK